MMKPATKMMLSYQKSPSIDNDEETADVPLVTTILPPTSTTTMSYHSKWMMIAIVAGMMMLMLGSTLLLQDGETAAEGLVVGELQENGPDGSCLAAPTDATFGGTSITVNREQQSAVPFETCYQYHNFDTYCWSKSYYIDAGLYRAWYECVPDGEGWHTVDPKYVNPVTHPYSCGLPCQDMSHEY